MTTYSCVKQCQSGAGVRCAFMWGGATEVGDNVCSRYGRPFAKWNKLGGCEGATHVVRIVATEGKTRVGQQKQKRGKK